MTRVAALPGDTIPVAERFRVTQYLRLGAVALVLLCKLFAADPLMPDRHDLVPWTLGFLGVALLAEGMTRALPRRTLLVFSGMLMVDGVYLAWATYLTGSTTSPLRYAMLLHLGAVCLLASYRTGIKLAVWHSLLVFTVRNMVSGNVLRDTSPDQVAGYGSPDHRLAIFIVVLWLVAISTS